MQKNLLKRLSDPFVLIFTALVWGIYSYTAISLTDRSWLQFFLCLPFGCVWLVPVVYWHGQRESRELRVIDHFIHVCCYLSMGWLNFIVTLTFLRDLLLWALHWSTIAWSQGHESPLPALEPWNQLLLSQGEFIVLFLSTLFWFLGTLKATGGPLLKEIEVEIPNLHPSLHHLRIVQISDLHIGTTIRKNYVERVVAHTNSLQPDLVVLTGDMVDGSVKDLKEHALPLLDLHSTYGSVMCLGNHDYYSGSKSWTEFWTQEVGVIVLRNEHIVLPVKPPLNSGYSPTHSFSIASAEAHLLIAGVIDPAARLEGSEERPDPIKALATPYAGSQSLEQSPLPPHFKIMLAHNPRLSPAIAKCGFDLQLSGHTHAGQFLPWTWATKWIHSPHYAGLSREGSMMVYVNSGTGSWGPPLRFGTSTELTLLRLVPGDPIDS